MIYAEVSHPSPHVPRIRTCKQTWKYKYIQVQQYNTYINNVYKKLSNLEPEIRMNFYAENR